MHRKIIAILRGVHPHEVLAICAALVQERIGMIEVPLNSPQPLKSISMIAKEFGDAATVGAGTVLTVKEVRDVHDVGGQIIVSPNTNVEVIAATKSKGMESWPGALSPSECFSALEAGADGLKIFPASLVGPSGVHALRAVLPSQTQIYAVGGAGPENFSSWIRAGANGFGIGTALYQRGFGEEDVRERAQVIVAAYDKAMKDDGIQA